MVFLIIWSGGLVELMMTMVTVTPCVLVFLRLGLHTNKLEDEIRLSRSKYHIAPGLARAFFSYLENAIKGTIGNDGKVMSKSYPAAKQDYIKQNKISPNDWVSDKVVVLFLESKSHNGDIHDIKKISRNKGEHHNLVLEPLRQEHELNAAPRQMDLNVVKIKTDMKIVKHGYGDTIKTDRGYFKQNSESEVPNFHDKYGEPDEQVSWKNNYVVLAENRPLMALFEMRRQKFLDETEYQLQFRLFYQEFKSLIEEDEDMRKHVHLYHYEDKPIKGNFSANLEKVVRELRN